MIFFYAGNKIAFAYRTAPGNGMSEKLSPFLNNLATAFSDPLPSFNPRDLIIAVVTKILLTIKQKNRKKFRNGEEYGSAKWGTENDIEPYIDSSDFSNNIILTQTERLTMGKPSAPKYARNKNVEVIGGSGSGKTRFFVKPNLMQMHSSYVVTDPKGTVLIECGKMLQRGRPHKVKNKQGKTVTVYEPYKIKVFNTIEFGKSMHFNPFAYIDPKHREKDILKFVNVLVKNTNGTQQQGGGDFWEKAEKLLYQAYIAMIFCFSPPEERNFETLIDMINLSECREDDETFKNAIDIQFEFVERWIENSFSEDDELEDDYAKLGKKKSLLTKSKSKKKVDKVAEKGVAKTAQVIAMALKSPVMSIVAPYGAAIVIVLLIILLILSMFNGVIEAIFGNSSWVMGTYTAQDKYLSQAEEYYTKLAYDTNENIIKCGTDDWEDGLEDLEDGLEDLEIDTDDMDDDPDNFYFGNSSHFPYNPVYDFDCYKLWSFLSAYYFNFETTAEDTEKGGEIEYWTYDGDTEAILDKLFKDEYKFEYYYDNTSRWEEKSSYDYYGGNFDSGYSYYKAEGPTKSWGNEHYDYSFKATNRPNEISEYLDDEGMLYIKRVNGEYRIVNPNNDWHNTGYLLQDQRFYLGDSAPAYYFKGGDNSKPYNFFINDSTKTRDSRAWDSDEAWFMITPGDSKQIFNDAGDDDWYYSVVKKYYWKTDCRLYYNVKQKATFDEAIKSILLQESHGDERYQYYLNFAGLSDDENAKNMHGNHQSFDSPIDGSIIDSVENGKIYNGFGYDMMEWNKHHCSLADEDESHQAIDIIYPELSNVYAPMDGYIKEINFDESYVIIRKDDFNYWYDGDGCGKTRDTEITLYGVSVSSNLSEDDEVKKGDIIGYSLPEAKCEDIDNNGIGEYYLHVKIQIDTDGVGWDFIDPRLVFY